LCSRTQELKRQCSLESVHTSGDRRTYAYLEAAHVWILAHVLRRPVVVFADDWVDSRGRLIAAAEEIAGALLGGVVSG
jgi:hypothetical protein